MTLMMTTMDEYRRDRRYIRQQPLRLITGTVSACICCKIHTKSDRNSEAVSVSRQRTAVFRRTLIRYIRLMSSQIRLSFVTFVQPTHRVELFGKSLETEILPFCVNIRRGST